MPGRFNNNRGGRGGGRGHSSQGRGGGRFATGKGKPKQGTSSPSTSKSSRRQHLFHPGGQADTKYAPFEETLQHMVEEFRTKTEWSKSQECTIALETMTDSPPTAPTRPTKDSEGKFDDLELAVWKSEETQYRSRKQEYDIAMATSAAHIFMYYTAPTA